MEKVEHPYQTWFAKSQRAWDKFVDENAFFAFDEKQFKEGLDELHVTEKDIVRAGYGMFVLKDKIDGLHQLSEKSDREMKEGMKDRDFVYDMFRSELANHEYCITGDYTETLDALNLTMDEVEDNPMWLEQLKKARNDYIKSMIEWEERRA